MEDKSKEPIEIKLKPYKVDFNSDKMRKEFEEVKKACEALEKAKKVDVSKLNTVFDI